MESENKFTALRDVVLLNVLGVWFPDMAITLYANGTAIVTEHELALSHAAILRKYANGSDATIQRKRLVHLVDLADDPPLGCAVFVLCWMLHENEELPEWKGARYSAVSVARQGDVDLSKRNKRRLHDARVFYQKRLHQDAIEVRAVGELNIEEKAVCE